MSIGLALAAALIWGTGDFLGGLATRRTPLLSVLVISQVFGLLGILAVAAAVGGNVRGSDLAAGAIGGLAGSAGIAMLYRGLATGAMSLVAPITAVVAVVIPVVVGIGSGERPAVLQDLGIAVAAAAVALLGYGGPAAARLDRRILVFAAGAGVAFGLFFVALSRASPAAGLWPLVSARGASVTALLGLTAVSRRRPRLGGTPVLVVLAAGAFDVIANALYLIAVHGGVLSIVSVLASLYPAATVLWSLALLRERLQRAQLAGVAAALAAVVLITAG